MTNKKMFDDIFPQDKQIGGIIINRFTFNLMSLFLRMNFLFSKEMLLSMCAVIKIKMVYKT
jgi:hypothetical protein